MQTKVYKNGVMKTHTYFIFLIDDKSTSKTMDIFFFKLCKIFSTDMLIQGIYGQGSDFRNFRNF